MIPSNSFNLETKLLIKASIGGTFYDFLDLTPTQAVGHGFDRRQQRQHQGVGGGKLATRSDLCYEASL